MKSKKIIYILLILAVLITVGIVANKLVRKKERLYNQQQLAANEKNKGII